MSNDITFCASKGCRKNCRRKLKYAIKPWVHLSVADFKRDGKDCEYYWERDKK